MGLEEGVSAHGSAFESGAEFFDVAAARDDGSGKFANDAGAVVAGDGDADGLRRGGFRVVLADGLDYETGDAGLMEIEEKIFDGVCGGIDADDAGELAGEADHMAFLPTAVVASYGFREGLDQAGAVGTKDGHDDGMSHERIASQVAADARRKRTGDVLFLHSSSCGVWQDEFAAGVGHGC